MGVQINRIEKEFIFTALINQRMALSAHGFKKETLFLIHSIAEEEVSLRPAEKNASNFEGGEDIRVFFAFQNNYYTFDSKIRSSNAEGLVIENPKCIYRDPQRKYERIRMKDVKLFYVLEDDKVELDFPKTDTFTMVEKPEYSDTFNPAVIGDLINSFRQSMQGKATDHRIVMFRDKSPQSVEERLMVKTGKTLWIPCTEDDLPLNDPSFSGNVIVKKEVEDFLAESGTPGYLVRSEIANLLYTKHKGNVYSEIYCPILYHEYAVGYIHVTNKRPKQEKCDQELLLFILQFSRVLSYSLEINGYYQKHAKTDVRHDAAAIDMSAGGLLFTTTVAEIDKKINLFQDLILHMDVAGRSLEVATRIMRKFKDTLHFYFAAQFMDLRGEDLNFLFEYLYGKAFDEKALASWEGGQPPPRLANG